MGDIEPVTDAEDDLFLSDPDRRVGEAVAASPDEDPGISGSETESVQSSEQARVAVIGGLWVRAETKRFAAAAAGASR